MAAATIRLSRLPEHSASLDLEDTTNSLVTEEAGLRLSQSLVTDEAGRRLSHSHSDMALRREESISSQQIRPHSQIFDLDISGTGTGPYL
jgi:hypothetical protein